ncbi:MAG TPA: M14 family zinc carboxypeptidase [Pirellulales bacterium]|nr:M14 family zinc carboxypeptidase [Pirellulales bacterium]
MHGRARIGAVGAGILAGLGWLSAAQSAETWQTLTRSVEDRVIEYCRFGEGGEQVLVVAPLAGDEVEGVEIAERLASHLEQFPRRLTDTAVTIVRDPNPDGRFRRTPGNARGVLLDRNFRTRHWRKIPQGDRWLSGREPESEPETRALADLLDDLKPQRIILLGSSRRGATLNYAGPAEQWAAQFAATARLRPLPLDSVDAAGAFAAYAGADRGLPTLIVRVPARSPAETNWSNYKRSLLAAIDGAGPAPAREITRATPSGASSASSQEPRRLTTAATSVALQSPGEPGPSGLADRPASPPHKWTVEDLERGGVVVPVGKPPRAVRPPSAPAPGGTSPPKTAPGPAAARSFVAKPPSAKLYDPTRPRAQATTPAASSGFSPFAPFERIQRLPPIDRPPPAIRDLRQEAIPFYPGTGF